QIDADRIKNPIVTTSGHLKTHAPQIGRKHVTTPNDPRKNSHATTIQLIQRLTKRNETKSNLPIAKYTHHAS
ncbi:hypothetical protein, partial [Rhizobium brockwellii]|uniref:hypothetical protein n=1 Tax=Rhizobium brockwellii TaxID=3019932 RepID=UPI003F9B841C